MSKTARAKEVKELGWDYISLTASTGRFGGAVHQYKGEKGTVAVGFTMHDAFILEDEDGLFTLADLKDGVLKAKNINLDALGEVEGIVSLAWEEDGEITFNEDILKHLGLNDFEVQDSVKNRLVRLSALDVLDNMPTQ